MSAAPFPRGFGLLPQHAIHAARAPARSAHDLHQGNHPLAPTSPAPKSSLLATPPCPLPLTRVLLYPARFCEELSRNLSFLGSERAGYKAQNAREVLEGHVTRPSLLLSSSHRRPPARSGSATFLPNPAPVERRPARAVGRQKRPTTRQTRRQPDENRAGPPFHAAFQCDSHCTGTSVARARATY